MSFGRGIATEPQELYQPAPRTLFVDSFREYLECFCGTVTMLNILVHLTDRVLA